MPVRQTRIASLVIEEEIGTGDVSVFVRAHGGPLDTRKHTEVAVTGDVTLARAIATCLQRASSALEAREDMRAYQHEQDYERLQRDLAVTAAERARC